MTRNVKGAWFTLLYLGLAFGLAAAGCKKTDSTGGNVPGGPVTGPPGGPGGNQSPQDVLAKLPGGDEFAAGKKVYADNNCARCHKLGDTGGGMMGGPPGAGGMPKGSAGGPPGGMANGPDLTKVGAAPEHTAAWLGDHIRDAKTHKPESKMPAFPADKISDADLASLDAYLAARK